MTSSQARTSCPAFAARSARSFRRSGCPRKPNRPRPGRTDPDRKPDTKDEAAPPPVMMLSPWRLLVLEAQRTISAGSWFGQGLLTSPAPPVCPLCKLFPFLILSFFLRCGQSRYTEETTSLISRPYRLLRLRVSWYGRYTRLGGLFGMRVADSGQCWPRAVTASTGLVLSPPLYRGSTTCFPSSRPSFSHLMSNGSSSGRRASPRGAKPGNS